MSPTVELQAAIVAALKTAPAVAARIGNRVYDSVPPKPVFPYVSFGPSDELSENADCIEGADIAIQIDVWSRAVGSAEAKEIASLVARVLDDADLALAVNALVYFNHEATTVVRDPDGLTTHAVVRFSAFVEFPS